MSTNFVSVTENQVNYIAALLGKHDTSGYALAAPAAEVANGTRVIAKSSASTLIKELLALPLSKGGKAATEAKAHEPITEDGMYRTASGAIYKVQFAVHGSGNLYAKRLVVLSEPMRDEEGTIVQAAEVSFEYERGAVQRLTREDKMTLAQAKEFGALYGTCCKCGKTLTKEESIAAGIGPVCASKGW